LSQEAVVFGDIRELLGNSLSACHFRNREYWLAIEAQTNFHTELQENVLSPITTT